MLLSVSARMKKYIMRKIANTVLLVSLAAGAILVFGCRQLAPEKRVDRKAPVRNEAWMDLRMGAGSDMLYRASNSTPKAR